MTKPLWQMVDKAERNAAAMKLIREGLSTQEAAEKMGCHPQTLLKMVKAHLKENAVTDAHEYRAIHTERLEMLFSKLMPQINNGNPYAIKVAVDVLKRQATLLGLDAPVTINIRRLAGEYAEKYGLDESERIALFDAIKRDITERRRADAGRSTNVVNVGPDDPMGASYE